MSDGPADISDPQHQPMNIRRFYIPEAVYFITSVTNRRKPIFRERANIELFWDTLVKVRECYPHELQAFVLLPDHFHFLIKPIGCSFSKLFQSLHRNYTVNFKVLYSIERNLTLWQHRFWDHVIRDEKDWQFHLNYIHYNPVKHGYVSRPEDWEFSSFREWVKRGAYTFGWGHTGVDELEKVDFE
jgi:putative transposase